MTARKLGAGFFCLYGLFIPILASDFMQHNYLATVAMVSCCLVLSVLLLVRRCELFNVLIAFYVFKVYLTRPYVDIFVDKLSESQLLYIEAYDSFFNAPEAAVIYFGMLSLLISWLVGVIISRPNHPREARLPRVFGWIDHLVKNSDWRFWIVFIFMVYLNYVPATVSWQGIASFGDESTALFAFGLTNPNMIGTVCLITFLYFLSFNDGPKPWMLLFPAIYSILISTASGSRGGAFLMLIYTILSLVILNYDKRLNISIKGTLVTGASLIALPIVIFAGLLAQSLKPLLRSLDVNNSALIDVFVRNINIFDPDNLILRNIYFGVTELLHRLSALEAQFYILGDHFINSPSVFNPLSSLMRAVNDLLPGSVFPGMLTINQLFNHIYFDEFSQYSSSMWGIQGTLYLYVGLWLSPFIVFLMAFFLSRRWNSIKLYVQRSPAFMTFIIILSLAVLENATIERVLPVDIVRPLVSFAIFTGLVRVLYAIFPRKRIHVK